MTPSILSRIAAFCALALAVAHAMQCARPHGTRELVIAHPAALAAIPLYLVAETPLAGEKIRLKPYTDHALAVAEFLRGESDLLFTGTTLGAMQAGKGVKLWRTPVWGTASIVLRPGLKKSTQNALQQLPGRRIALPFKGSPNDVQLQRLLKAQSITAVIEYHVHAQAATLLLAGKLDAAVLPEPLASKLIAEHKLNRLAELAELEAGVLGEEAPSPMVSFFLSGKLSAEKQQRLPELQVRLLAAIARIDKDPAGVAGHYAQNFHVSADVLREGLRHTYFALPEPAIARKRTLSFLHAAGIVNTGENFLLP